MKVGLDMKRLKKNQIGPWCSYCEPKTSKATHREDGFAGKFCCDIHKDALSADEKASREREDRYTEADHQTWGQL